MVNHDTLIEEHIAGIPKDTFIEVFAECNEAESPNCQGVRKVQ